MGEWGGPAAVVVAYLAGSLVGTVVGGFVERRRGRRESDTSTIPSEGAVRPQERRNAEIGSPVTTQAGDGQERADG